MFSSFDGSGYIDLDNKLIKHSPSFRTEITLELSTGESEGLILWQGSRAEGDGFFGDMQANYIAIAGRRDIT